MMGEKRMDGGDWKWLLVAVGFFVVWFVLQRWVLPWLGVPT